MTLIKRLEREAGASRSLFTERFPSGGGGFGEGPPLSPLGGGRAPPVPAGPLRSRRAAALGAALGTPRCGRGFGPRPPALPGRGHRAARRTPDPVPAALR